MRVQHAGDRITVARAAHWTRRTRDFGISTVGLTFLLFDLLSGRARQVWIGDSHAVCFNRRFATANILRAGGGVYVVHVGARLMFSISRRGLPRWSDGLMRIVRSCNRRRVALLVCFGEIDVRCHLAKHGAGSDTDLEFVNDYVKTISAAANTPRFIPIVFVVPPPPCREHMNLHNFPVVGTFQQRRQAFDSLRTALKRFAVEAGDRFQVIDATALLEDEHEGMRTGLTDDRCHVNLEGVAVVRTFVQRQLDRSMHQPTPVD